MFWAVVERSPLSATVANNSIKDDYSQDFRGSILIPLLLLWDVIWPRTLPQLSSLVFVCFACTVCSGGALPLSLPESPQSQRTYLILIQTLSSPPVATLHINILYNSNCIVLPLWAVFPCCPLHLLTLCKIKQSSSLSSHISFLAVLPSALPYLASHKMTSTARSGAEKLSVSSRGTQIMCWRAAYSVMTGCVAL